MSHKLPWADLFLFFKKKQVYTSQIVDMITSNNKIMKEEIRTSETKKEKRTVIVNINTICTSHKVDK